MEDNPTGKLPQVVLKAGDETVGFYDLDGGVGIAVFGELALAVEGVARGFVVDVEGAEDVAVGAACFAGFELACAVRQAARAWGDACAGDFGGVDVHDPVFGRHAIDLADVAKHAGDQRTRARKETKDAAQCFAAPAFAVVAPNLAELHAHAFGVRVPEDVGLGVGADGVVPVVVCGAGGGAHFVGDARFDFGPDALVEHALGANGVEVGFVQPQPAHALHGGHGDDAIMRAAIQEGAGAGVAALAVLFGCARSFAVLRIAVEGPFGDEVRGVVLGAVFAKVAHDVEEASEPGLASSNGDAALVERFVVLGTAVDLVVAQAVGGTSQDVVVGDTQAFEFGVIGAKVGGGDADHVALAVADDGNGAILVGGAAVVDLPVQLADAGNELG